MSVVVPVYNPGRFIEPCIQSMLDQSLPRTEFEVVFVDDGSTDETPARLDTLAAEQPLFRVIHTPNSGWSGTPRNIGIAEARGEYVQFLDQDDRMAPEALERLSTMADTNRSDIVLGKVASDFRGVPQNVFRRNRAACTIQDAPLIDSLTVHKLFRRSFLIDHDIRFPGGKHRLDDQLFMVRAYFRARTVAILADYTCYFYARRDDRGNAGSTQIEPESYYANVREVIDVVLANTRAGEFRDRLLRRFLRVEMLGRLSEPAVLRYAPAYRERTITAVRDLTTDLIDERVDAGLPALQRLRVGLLRRDDRAGLLELARRASEVRCLARADSVAWDRGRLRVAFEAGLDRPGGDGEALFVSRDHQRVILGPALTDGLPIAPIDITHEIRTLRADLLLRDPVTGTEWIVPSKASSVPGPSVRAVATVEPRRLAGGRPLAPGTWEAWVRVTGVGFDRRSRLFLALPAVTGAASPAIVAGGPPAVVTSLDLEGGMTLVVERELPAMRDPSAAAGPVRALATRSGPVFERAAWRVYYRLPAFARATARATFRRLRAAARA